MECKLYLRHGPYRGKVGINRYIMECKSFCASRKDCTDCTELIDTLWNVNLANWWKSAIS